MERKKISEKTHRELEETWRKIKSLRKLPKLPPKFDIKNHLDAWLNKTEDEWREKTLKIFEIWEEKVSHKLDECSRQKLTKMKEKLKN